LLSLQGLSSQGCHHRAVIPLVPSCLVGLLKRFHHRSQSSLVPPSRPSAPPRSTFSYVYTRLHTATRTSLLHSKRPNTFPRKTPHTTMRAYHLSARPLYNTAFLTHSRISYES
jgi:hypothetical protein